MKSGYTFLASLLSFGLVTAAHAQSVTVDINAITASGIGDSMGKVMLQDGANGLEISTDLKGLPPGPHGFHIHENGDCGPKERDGKPVAGLAAGDHLDPHGTKAHHGPQSPQGHLGDLPVLNVKDDGSAKETLTAPRLKLADIKGKSIMIHEGGDNFSDTPKPLGGGGTRIACGVIK